MQKNEMWFMSYETFVLSKCKPYSDSILMQLGAIILIFSYFMPKLVVFQVRHRFGCYDEISGSGNRRVRHCNWVRFLRVANIFSPAVNLVATKVRGEPVYEAVKPIPPDTELLVYYLPERPEELFFVRMRTSLYRQTMDSILEGTVVKSS